MAVQRLPNPRLVTDSMGAGGTPHESFGGGPPGSQGVEPSPQAFEVPDIGTLLEPAPGNDRRLVAPGGAMSGEKDAPFPQGDGFAQADLEDSDAALWKKTPSSM